MKNKTMVLALFIFAVVVLITTTATIMTHTPGATSAAETVGDTGTPDTSWYNSVQTSFTIDSADELAGLAQLVNGGNDFSGKTITLANDIDLTPYASSGWTPIGVAFWSTRSFNGTFDGNYHIIQNLNIFPSATITNVHFGLFGTTGADGIIENLGISGGTISCDYLVYADSCVGGVVGRNNGTVTNCYYAGTIYSSNGIVGGVAGWNFGTITDCYNMGCVNGTDEIVGYIGGVAAYNSGTVLNCYNTGTISGGYYVGGVVAYSPDVVINCYNTGTVSGIGDSFGVGGVIGVGPTTNCYNTGSISGETAVGGVAGVGSATNCYNTGSISGTTYIGGVAGAGNNVTDCYNAGSISGTEDVGGVVGYNNPDDIVTGCYNTGTVSGTKNVGGVVGGNDEGYVTNCYNVASVDGTCKNVGGVVGNNNGDITSCYNTASVNGTKNVGGVVGINYDSVTSCYNVGLVVGVSKVGGAVGHNYDSDCMVEYCYYNSDSGPDNGLGKPLITAQMVAADTLTNYMTGLNSDSDFIKRTTDANLCYYPELKVFYNGTEQQQTVSKLSVTVNRIGTVITVPPTVSAVTAGEPLSTSTFSGGTAMNATKTVVLNGTFAWEDGTIKPKDSSSYSYVFIPFYSDLYKNSSGIMKMGKVSSVTNYSITATADSGSTISPSGIITIQSGSNQTFIFSALSGHYVYSVMIDDKPLTQTQIDLGSYTFSNVVMDHTISITSATGPGPANITLTIEIYPDGGGYAEYSTDGQTFTQYTVTVIIPSGSDIFVKAHENNGYTFDNWAESSGVVHSTSEVFFPDLERSLHLTLYFKESGQGSGNDNSNIWWLVLAAIILLILVGLLLWFLLFYRRYYDVIKPENVSVIGDDRVHRKSEYAFTINGGFSGVVSYRLGDEEDDLPWEKIYPDAKGKYIIPKGMITDDVTIECRWLQA